MENIVHKESMSEGTDVTDSKARIDEILTKLRIRHYRLTLQRMAILELLTASTDHPGAADLYDQIRSRFPTISLATGYKTLDLL